MEVKSRGQVGRDWGNGIIAPKIACRARLELKRVCKSMSFWLLCA